MATNIAISVGQLITAEDINQEYRLARSSFLDSANRILNVGRMLTEKKAELGHGNFMPWVEAECEFSHWVANRCMKAWSNCGLTNNLTEADALQISRDTWGNRDTIALKHTGDHESYTPSKYLDSARSVMGGFDVDPASNEMAQENVRATTFYTADDNGLEKEWRGRVWLNPPYEYPLIQQFINKLCESYASGAVTEAVLLTNNSADTQWFHDAAIMAGVMCFTAGRINFLKRDGSTSSPTNGQTFFYFGDNDQRFIEAFSAHGLVVKTVD